MKTLFNKSIVLLFTTFSLLTSTLIYSQTYSSYNDLAKDAYDKKNYELTIEYCNKSINIQPNGWAYWERANAEWVLYKNKEAAEDYGKAIPYYTENISLGKLYFYRGDCYYALFNYKDAIDDYNKAYNYGYEEYGKLYQNRGNAYRWNGDYSKAIDDYTKAIPYFNSNLKNQSKIYQSMASCNNSLSRYDDAIKGYSKAIDIDPGNASAYQYRAYVYAKKYNYKMAKEDLSKAIQFNTDTLFGQYNKASMLNDRGLYNYYLGNYEDGLKDCKAANETDTLLKTNWNMGLNYGGLGNYPKAIEYYNKERNNRKDSSIKATLSRNIALNYRNMLNYKTALEEVNKAILWNEKYADAYLTRAEIKKVQKNYLSAIDDYDKALQLYGDDKAYKSTVYKDRGEVYVKLKNLDRAFYDYKKYLELFPENANTLYEYGRFLIANKKDISDAKEKLQKCVSLCLASDTSSDYSYAKLFLGDKDEAINNTFRLIDKYRFDKYQYKWELHVMACIYALSGNSKKAIEYQDKSFKEGLTDFNHLLNDRDLESIRNLPEYKALLIKYKMPIPKY